MTSHLDIFLLISLTGIFLQVNSSPTTSEEQFFSPPKYPELSYTISTTWDNRSSPDLTSVHISFQLVDSYLNSTNRGIIFKIDAPFYDDPPISDKVPTDEPTLGLWNYEVIEAFFLGRDEEYLEIELGPRGHYILLYLKYLNGTANLVTYKLPLYNYVSTCSTVSKRWLGQALIPAEYFPCGVNRFNAHGIHGSVPRVFMSLFPVPKGEFENPDFHRLEYFQGILFGDEINPKCVE